MHLVLDFYHIYRNIFNHIRHTYCHFILSFYYCFNIYFITGIPDSNEEDAKLAQSLGLSWNSVLKTQEDGSEILMNSAEVHSPSHLYTLNLLPTVTSYQLSCCSFQVKAVKKLLTL